ncbi:hypothetical protein O5264_28350, partial [Escherichia coli]|nr:hypothetical protein [Escherichia coli]
MNPAFISSSQVLIFSWRSHTLLGLFQQRVAERFPGKIFGAHISFDRELFGGIVGWCDSEGN